MICPKCKWEFVKEDESYKCTNCKIRLPVAFYGYKLKQEDIDKLVLEGITNEIEFYSSTKRKKFKAKLVYEHNKIEFDFQHKEKKGQRKHWKKRQKRKYSVYFFEHSFKRSCEGIFDRRGQKR